MNSPPARTHMVSTLSVIWKFPQREVESGHITNQVSAIQRKAQSTCYHSLVIQLLFRSHLLELGLCQTRHSTQVLLPVQIEIAAPGRDLQLQQYPCAGPSSPPFRKEETYVFWEAEINSLPCAGLLQAARDLRCCDSHWQVH